MFNQGLWRLAIKIKGTARGHWWDMKTIYLLIFILVTGCMPPDEVLQDEPASAKECPLILTITWGCAQTASGSDVGIDVRRAVTCPLCMVENPELAVDGDLRTYARVWVPAEASTALVDGGVTLDVRRRNGKAFARGDPGVVFSFGAPSYGGYIHVGMVLQGQEDFPHSPYNAQIQTAEEAPPYHYWTGGGALFDTIRVQIGADRFPEPVVNMTVNVHEICRDSKIVDVCIPD